MAVHNVRLPEDIERGAVGGPGFKTTIITLANGAEQRNQDWQVARGSWDIGYGLQNLDQLRTVDDFFRARRGKAHGFRFKDWYDYKAVAQTVGTVDGQDLQRQLQKVYPDDVNAYTRKIVLPVEDTLIVYLDGIATDAYTLLANGIILFDDDPVGHTIAATFEFDVPVRFDIDRLPVNVENFSAGSIAGISLVEVRQ